MPDNVGYTPGTGTRVATREVSYSGEAAQAQAVGLVTFSGSDDAKTATDVNSSNPLPIMVIGELIEAMQAMRLAINSLTRSVGQMLPDTSGRMRVNIETIAGSQTIGTVTTITTLTNQTQIGALSATEHIPALMRLAADSLRRNITVT